MTDKKNKIISPGTAAIMLGVSPAILRYWRKTGKYPQLRWVELWSKTNSQIKMHFYYLEDVIEFQKTLIYNNYLQEIINGE